MKKLHPASLIAFIVVFRHFVEYRYAMVEKTYSNSN